MIRSNQITIDQNHQLSTKSCCLFNSKKVFNNNHRHYEKIKKQFTSEELIHIVINVIRFTETTIFNNDSTTGFTEAFRKIRQSRR